MSYGSASGVAALCTLWTRDGAFYDAGASDTATKPTLAQVNAWLEEVSSLLDICFADAGFITPVTDTDVLPAINVQVEGMVKDLVDHSHKAGRFYADRAIKEGVSPIPTIAEDLCNWVNAGSQGFERLGVGKIPGAKGRNEATFDVL